MTTDVYFSAYVFQTTKVFQLMEGKVYEKPCAQ